MARFELRALSLLFKWRSLSMQDVYQELNSVFNLCGRWDLCIADKDCGTFQESKRKRYLRGFWCIDLNFPVVKLGVKVLN